MKKRYLLLPLILISLILLIIDFNKEKISTYTLKEDNMEIYYPYFANDFIDKSITNYLNDYIMDYRLYEKDYLFIDYDYEQENDKYKITFYTYALLDNKLNNVIDTFYVDLNYDSIKKTKTINETNDYDFYNYKKIDSQGKMIAFTFDDGPNYNTSKLLDILAKYNVKATFFVVGNRVGQNEKIIKKMNDLQMEIGNHTYTHLLLPKHDLSQVKEEVDLTNKAIYNITNKYPNLLRPSYGSVSNKIKKNIDMPIILWNLDTLDWKYHNSKKIANKILNKVKDGDIILMHDIYSATVNAVDMVIPLLLERGYQIVSVSELFYYKNLSLEENNIYFNAR